MRQSKWKVGDFVHCRHAYVKDDWRAYVVQVVNVGDNFEPRYIYYVEPSHHYAMAIQECNMGSAE